MKPSSIINGLKFVIKYGKYIAILVLVIEFAIEKFSELEPKTNELDKQ